LILGLNIAALLYREHGERLTVMHVTDGRHMRGSLHYVGNAADLRFPKRHPDQIATELRKRLGSDFDVVVEKTHIHIEYQPKIGINQRGG
jgi:hypothetical protein